MKYKIAKLLRRLADKLAPQFVVPTNEGATIVTPGLKGEMHYWQRVELRTEVKLGHELFGLPDHVIKKRIAYEEREMRRQVRMYANMEDYLQIEVFESYADGITLRGRTILYKPDEKLIDDGR